MKIVLFILLFISNFCFAQRRENDNEQLLTAGFQFRPVFASRFLGAGELSATDEIFKSTLKPKLGYTFGMVIRRGLTKKISIEISLEL